MIPSTASLKTQKSERPCFQACALTKRAYGSRVPEFLVIWYPYREGKVACFCEATPVLKKHNRFRFSMLTAKPITLPRQNSVITLIFLDIFTFLWYHFKYEMSPLVEHLAAQLIRDRAIPLKAAPTRLPIAFASVNAIPYLATWHYTHLANPHQRRQMDKTGFVKRRDRCLSSLKPQRT